ncbi:MAG: response regulator [Chloroflexota bacterium]
MNPKRLLIIDDHDDVREALEARLSAAPEIDVIGCTSSWELGLQRALKLEPDVVLLETKRTDGEGLEALQCLADRCAGAEVIVLTSYLDAEERDVAWSNGAARYLLKDIDTDRLVREIQSLTQ